MKHKDPAFIKPDWSIDAIGQRAEEGLSYCADSEKLLEHARNLLQALEMMLVNPTYYRAKASRAIASAVSDRDAVQ